MTTDHHSYMDPGDQNCTKRDRQRTRKDKEIVAPLAKLRFPLAQLSREEIISQVVQKTLFRNETWNCYYNFWLSTNPISVKGMFYILNQSKFPEPLFFLVSIPVLWIFQLLLRLFTPPSIKGKCYTTYRFKCSLRIIHRPHSPEIGAATQHDRQEK